MITLSSLVGRPVRDAQGRKLGFVRDLLVREGRVRSITCDRLTPTGYRRRHIAWARVASFGPEGVRLAEAKADQS